MGSPKEVSENQPPKAVRRAVPFEGYRPAVAGNRLRGAASSVRSDKCSPLRPFEQAGQKRDDQESEKDEEQYLRDASRCTGDAAETKRAGYDRHDEKYERPVKHGSSPSEWCDENVSGCGLFHLLPKKTMLANRQRRNGLEIQG
jgi:hypothetical protein